MAKFKKGDPKPANSGKKKGTPNKITKTFKEVLLDAFNYLQEKPKVNLRDWGKENPSQFYQIASKLIPTEVQAKVESTTITIQDDTAE